MLASKPFGLMPYQHFRFIITSRFSVCIAALSDSETSEYGGFHNVHHECKDNCSNECFVDHK